ncbi:hypothetical protein Tco_0842582 [Tanacetum coccineum]|uniref:Uncharacterized protein n=1 Tax=Tanacetum coccineum TaxID=301880 RepID=A0ABQ5AZP0_9ASTR
MTFINANALSNYVSLQCLSSLLNTLLQNAMAEQNVLAQPPTRTDEQIVPCSQWLTIGKSNLLFNAQKIQKNLIFQISVDILSNTNFFQAFTASANALAITPVNPAHPFEFPPSGDTVIDFVNELGYLEPVEIVSRKTSGSDKPRHNQCLTRKDFCAVQTQTPISANSIWESSLQTNVDHADLLWEAGPRSKKVTPLLIPYGRFSKVIIYYLASNYNIHRRPDSAVHHTRDDFILGNLKFVPKGETVEVFGMAIPDPLITEAIQQSSYYPKYLEMVAKNTKKTPQESASVQLATKRAPPKKPTTLLYYEKEAYFPTVEEDDEAQQESVPQEEGDDPDLELAKKMSLEAHQEKGEGEGADADMERAIKLSLDPAFLPQGRAPLRSNDQGSRSRCFQKVTKDQGKAGSNTEKAQEAPGWTIPEPMQETRLDSDS